MSSNSRLVRRTAFAVALVSFAVFGSSCGKKESAEKEASEDSTAAVPSPAPAPASALNDANILATLLMTSKLEIESASAALERCQSAAVKAYAKQVIADCGSASKQVSDLASKLGLDPEANDASRQLEVDADAARKSIDGAKGAAFDKAYIDNEVAYHQSVLDLLDNTIIPAVTNPELKTFLSGTRPTVEAHLDHAKHVQASLQG